MPDAPLNALESTLKTERQSFRAKMALGFGGGLLLLVVVLPLAYFTSSVVFRVEPPRAAEGARVSVVGGAGVVVFDTAYVLGDVGRAVLRAESPGYISRDVGVGSAVAAAGPGILSIEMRPAPVWVVVTAEPSLEQIRWRVDGVLAATAEYLEQGMQPGVRRIEAAHEFYRPQVLSLTVPVGPVDNDLTRELKLTPVAGVIHIRSQPPGAQLWINDEHKGVTPFDLEDAPGGLYRLRLVLPGYEPVEEEAAITNASPAIERDYRLRPQQAEVRVTTAPAGGVLRVNGVATEMSGAALSLAAGQTHRLRYEKPGYAAQSREVLLQVGERGEVAFALEKEMGEVVIRTSPPAELFVNGAPMGMGTTDTPRTLRLQSLPQRITLSRDGYRSVELTLTPRAAAPILIERELQRKRAARPADAPPLITAPAGITMKLFDPRQPAKSAGRFTMGAPPGEKFRRANEFQRKVKLTRAFYISTTEITEAQFAQYQPGRAGRGGKNDPVRNVSWLQAAGFANWLSARAGLRPAYRIANGRLQGFDPAADGYRLPSEAEWEWLARVAGRAGAGGSANPPARFVWGNATTIPKNSGNFADERAKVAGGGVSKYIPRYDDSFAGVAPVASFAADAAGLYDMAGNVSEWVHDAYDLQPPGAEVEVDPFGADHGEGQLRVVKGASFRTADVAGLRSSFREGLQRGRDDVGFRVARYLYGRE